MCCRDQTIVKQSESKNKINNGLEKKQNLDIFSSSCQNNQTIFIGKISLIIDDDRFIFS
jgi:hypothetical protein